MKISKIHVEKRKMMSRFRSEYFRRFGNIISIHEEGFKPLIDPNDFSMYQLENMMIPFMEEEDRLKYPTFINKKRSRSLVELRMVFMKILRATGSTFTDIGKYMGKDHSTVIYNINTCDDLLLTDEKFKELYNNIITTLRINLKFQKKNGKTNTVMPDASALVQSTDAITAYINESKSRKSVTKSERRSRSPHKKRLSGYRVSSYHKRQEFA